MENDSFEAHWRTLRILRNLWLVFTIVLILSVFCRNTLGPSNGYWALVSTISVIAVAIAGLRWRSRECPRCGEEFNLSRGDGRFPSCHVLNAVCRCGLRTILTSQSHKHPLTAGNGEGTINQEKWNDT